MDMPPNKTSCKDMTTKVTHWHILQEYLENHGLRNLISKYEAVETGNKWKLLTSQGQWCLVWPSCNLVWTWQPWEYSLCHRKSCCRKPALQRLWVYCLTLLLSWPPPLPQSEVCLGKHLDAKGLYEQTCGPSQHQNVSNCRDNLHKNIEKVTRLSSDLHKLQL